MLATVCHRHQRLVPMGERCEDCSRENAKRRNRRNRELGRSSAHWRALSARMVARVRRDAGGRCPCCGTPERERDQGSKLTCDLVGGGDHARARESECEVKCRRCHGRQQGGLGRPAS